MNTMTKKNLVSKIACSTGERQRIVQRIIDEALEHMCVALTRGERIELRRFGVFSVKFREEKTTKNPKTGNVMKIPPRKVAHFKPGKTLFARLNQK